MADLKGTGVELLGSPQRDVGIGATVSTPLIPTADVAPVTSKAASPIEQRLLDILGDDFTGVGSGDSKVTVGQKMSEATKSGSRRARGLRLLEEGFEGQDKKAEITAAFDHAKHKIAREKADIEKVAAKQKRIKEDFVIRSQEINVGVSNALRLAQLGRNDEASKILTDMVNASTQKEGVKTVITGIDPQSSKIQGFTQPVDEQGNAIGEPLPLRADSTLMNTFRGVDLSSAFTLSEQARQEAVATARGEQAGVEQALGRQETQEEREIRAGVTKPITREETGGVGAFEGTKKQIEEAGTIQKSFAVVESIEKEIMAIDETAFSATGKLALGVENTKELFAGLAGLAGMPDIEQDVRDFSIGETGDIASQRVALNTIGESLKFITAGIFGQTGKAASDKDIKIMEGIIANPTGIFTSKKRTLEAIATLKRLAGSIATKSTEIAKEGIAGSIEQPVSPKDLLKQKLQARRQGR